MPGWWPGICISPSSFCRWMIMPFMNASPNCAGRSPCHDPRGAASADLINLAASRSRVVLTGDGGDEILYPSKSYIYKLAKGLRLAPLAAGSGALPLPLRPCAPGRFQDRPGTVAHAMVGASPAPGSRGGSTRTLRPGLTCRDRWQMFESKRPGPGAPGAPGGLSLSLPTLLSSGFLRTYDARDYEGCRWNFVIL